MTIFTCSLPAPDKLHQGIAGITLGTGHSPDCNSFRTRLAAEVAGESTKLVQPTTSGVLTRSGFCRKRRPGARRQQPTAQKKRAARRAARLQKNGNNSLLFQARLDALRHNMATAGSSRSAPAMTVLASGTGTMNVIKSWPPAAWGRST